MKWLQWGAIAAFWVAALWWLVRRVARDECPACKGSGEAGRSGRFCGVCKGTGNRPKPEDRDPVGWRMTVAPNGDLWWESTLGHRACGLCYDSRLVVDAADGYTVHPCPQCSGDMRRDTVPVTPSGVNQHKRAGWDAAALYVGSEPKVPSERAFAAERDRLFPVRDHVRPMGVDR